MVEKRVEWRVEKLAFLKVERMVVPKAEKKAE